MTGASHIFGQGYLVAHVGSKTACGAIIASGSPDTFVEEPSPMKTYFMGASETSSETFDKCFQFIDEETQEPVRNMPYRIECDGVISYSGYTDDYGRTLRVYTEKSKKLSVYLGNKLTIGEERNSKQK